MRVRGLLGALALLGITLTVLAQGGRPPWPPPPIKPPAPSVPLRDAPPRVAPAQSSPMMPAPMPSAPVRPSKTVPVVDAPDPTVPVDDPTESLVPVTGLQEAEVIGAEPTPPPPAPVRALPVAPFVPMEKTHKKLGGDGPDLGPPPTFQEAPEFEDPFATPAKKDADVPKLMQFPQSSGFPPSESVELQPKPPAVNEVIKNSEVQPFQPSKAPTPLKVPSQPPGHDVVVDPSPTPLKVKTQPRGHEVGVDHSPTPMAVPMPTPAAPPAPSAGVVVPVAPLRTAVPIRRSARPAEPSRDVITKSYTPETSNQAREVGLPKSAGPMLTLEKRGPAAVSMGQPARYEIVVHNVGGEAASQVRVEEDLADGVRYLGGNPQPVLQGSKVVWNLDALAPGAKHQLFLDLQATSAGEVSGQTSVSLGGGVKTRVTAPIMELTATGPGRVAVGKTAPFEIKLTNAAKQKLTGLVMQVTMGAGLRHVLGKTVEADVGDVEPGDTRTIQLSVDAEQAGRHALEVRVRANDGQEAVAQASVLVGNPALTLQLETIGQVRIDQDCELAIEVGNFTPQLARNIIVTDTLPEGLEFVSASDRGLYRAVTRSVHWVVEGLAAGQTRTLKLRVRPKTAESHVHRVAAQSREGLRAQAEGTVSIEGQPRLSLKIIKRDELVQIGRETMYEIRVINEGTTPDTGVELRAVVPAGMMLRSAQGPVAGRMEGQTIVFQPLEKLEGRRQAIYQVTVQAQAAGELRFRAELNSEQLRTPLIQEERTRVQR